MRIRRDVSSIPQRSAGRTWDDIVELITGADSQDGEQLRAAAAVMASVITDEHPASRPFVIEGVGPQLRLYCRYGLHAVEAGDSIDALTWNPTAGDWTLHIPCDAANMEWVRRSLARSSPRIRVFDVAADDAIGDTGFDASPRSSTQIVVDWHGRGR